jgi:heterodisulfide reductase subunit D
MKLETTLQDLYSEVAHCNKCGVCTYGEQPALSPLCPMYTYDKSFTFSPSGLNYITRALVEGHIDYSEAIADFAFSCAGCGVCDDMCSALASAKPHAGPWDVTRRMRAEMVRKGLVPKGTLSAMTKAVKKDGDMLDKGQGLSLEIPKKIKADNADMVLYAECFHSPSQAAIYGSTVSLLEKIGKPVSLFSDGGCCGSSLYDFGFWDELQPLIEKKSHTMKNLGGKEFIFVNPHCQEFIVRRYPELLTNYEAVKAMHVSELLAQALKEGILKSRKNGKVKVSYHDPCYLGRGLGLYQAPRDTLTSLQGVELIEMQGNKGDSFCCGARALGKYHPEFSKETARKRIDDFNQTGADILITACPYCKQAFQSVLPLDKKELVKDITEFVDERTDKRRGLR